MKREGLVRHIRIEVLLLPGAILNQKEERKLVKGFSSGMIPERILVVISFEESSNSSVWDELNFENSSQIAGKFTKREKHDISG